MGRWNKTKIIREIVNYNKTKCKDNLTIERPLITALLTWNHLITAILTWNQSTCQS